MEDFGTVFTAAEGDQTVWAPFAADTDYFGRHEQQLMVNYRVRDLDAMLAQLREAGVEVDENVARDGVRPLRLGRRSRRQPLRALGARMSEPTPPSDEQLLQQLEEELKKLKVSDLLVQTLYTVSSLGYRKLSAEDRDLDEARLAIEALRALLPVLEGSAPDELVRDFKQVTSNLQLAYADASKGKNGEADPS